MKLHGFGDKFVNMIHECISSTLFWILINGSPFGFFTPRGLRQVDLMSSVLFTIYFDLLSRLITRAESQQDIHGVKISRGGPLISHLMFADDLAIFCKATESEAIAITKT